MPERGGVSGFEQDRRQEPSLDRTASVQLLAAQQPAQPAQPDRVALAEWGEDEVDRPLDLDLVVGVQRHRDRVDEGQQRAYRHLVAYRSLARRRQHGNAVGHEDPAQRLVATLAADHDRHLAPRDAVQEVGRPEPRGDVRGLLRR